VSEWLIWGVLLFLQNAAHTATSRSRNSQSLAYTAIASVFSNGIWLASQFYIVNQLIQAKGDPLRFTLVLVFYVILTAAGSVASQWYLMRFEARKGILRG
jgi:hypothetical protein